MVSKGEKCHFWAYLVFYQTPSSCTLSNQVPGYSMVSKGEKCCFWAVSCILLSTLVYFFGL